MAKNTSFKLDDLATSERIAKRIARAGLCSRREAEARILDGRVSVNGKIVDSPALNVGTDDEVLMDGRPLPSREPTQLFRYYKPRGLVVSARDEKNRQTIFDVLPAHLPRLISVGRLDIDSEGLLLLTNDGDLARHLELPATGWSRKYRVRVQGQVDESKLIPLADGVTIDGVRYGSVIARLDRQMPSNAWLTVAIREGKNREVRRIMEYLGHKVGRLIRVSYGPFQLGDLDEGAVEAVKPRILAEQLGMDAPEDLNANDGKQKLKLKPRAKSGGRPGAKSRAGKPGGGKFSAGKAGGGKFGNRAGKSSGGSGERSDSSDHKRGKPTSPRNSTQRNSSQNNSKQRNATHHSSSGTEVTKPTKRGPNADHRRPSSRHKASRSGRR